jgi:outer membrane protease
MYVCMYMYDVYVYIHTSNEKIYMHSTYVCVKDCKAEYKTLDMLSLDSSIT